MRNKKYELLNISLNAMEMGAFNLLIARGDPGMGKTHNVLNFVKEKGLDYAYIKTYSTPLKFYEILYKNRHKKMIIFDDLSNIGDIKILGMLKSACWGGDGEDREVSYYTTSKVFEKLKIPNKFKVDASIILIFNGVLPNLDAIVSRGVSINFDFTFADKLSIFKSLGEDSVIDSDIIEYVNKSCSEATKNLSIRSLVILSEIKRKGLKWKTFSDEILKSDEDVELLLSLVTKHPKLKEACDEWMEQTGKSRSTFMRTLREIKIK